MRSFIQSRKFFYLMLSGAWASAIAMAWMISNPERPEPPALITVRLRAAPDWEGKVRCMDPRGTVESCGQCLMDCEQLVRILERGPADGALEYFDDPEYKAEAQRQTRKAAPKADGRMHVENTWGKAGCQYFAPSENPSQNGRYHRSTRVYGWICKREGAL